MTAGLNSDDGAQLYRKLLPITEATLLAGDERRFSDAAAYLNDAQAQLAAAKTPDAEEAFLNDLYLIDAWFRLLASYNELWERILNGQFSASWDSLQNALDTTRALKRLSGLDVGFFEEQLTNLEAAYPYKMFFSIGAVASRIECSICGKDIDSMECPHRRGHRWGNGLLHHSRVHEARPRLDSRQPGRQALHRED